MCLPLIVKCIQPKLVVELGTGDGLTASGVMKELPHGSMFYTVNWPNPPSGDNPLRYLESWKNDPRLVMISGDTRSYTTVSQIPNGIDLLYIDSTHESGCAFAEWNLYRPKLTDDALVVVDDLDHNDMMVFWNSLEFYKAIFYQGRVGVFRYGDKHASAGKSEL